MPPGVSRSVAKAHVIFDVARHLTPVHVHPALELVEDVGGRLAEDVGEHVQPAAMGHADHHLLLPLAAGTLNQLVQQRDERVAALQGEAFLADVALVQIFLDPLGGGQQRQQPAAVRRIQLRRGPIAFKPFLDPALLLGVGDVHVFRADPTAVGLLQHGDDVTQRHAVRGIERAGMEDDVEVVRPQVVIGRVQIRDFRRLAQLDRIEVRHLVTAKAVAVDQPQDRRLFLGGGGLQPFGRAGAGAGAALRRQPQEILPHRTVRRLLERRLVGRLPTQGVEARAPRQVDALGVEEIPLVEILDKVRVAAIKRAGTSKQIQDCAHAEY